MSDESDPTVAGRGPRRESGPTDVGTIAGKTVASDGKTVASDPPPPDPNDNDGILIEIRRAPHERLQHEDEVAEGGMGRIDVAIDRALDRRVAKKTIHEELVREPRTLGLFLREARITGQLDHPNIVPVYDIGAETVAGADSLYFTMKLVNGQTMRQLIRVLPPGAIDPLALFALLDACTRVCDALAFAHSKGVVHCDVKADNVMVGDFGQVYLMDWGIARSSDASHGGAGEPPPGEKAVFGSASYMSPEQAKGLRAELDARSDVFLMGALLYEIVTRRPPYRAREHDQTLALAAEGRYATPSALAGEGVVPVELERIILKAMAVAPADRYADTDALKEDLVRFMRGGAEFAKTEVKAGTTIVTEGERGSTAYIIVSGRCKVTKRIERSETLLQTLGPGDVFGEMAVLNETTRSATVVAVEDSTLLVVSGEQLLREMGTLKPWMASIMQRLAARLQDMYATRKVQTFMQGLPADKLAMQMYMHLSTWGERGADGRLRGRWSEVGVAIEQQLGVPATSIGIVLARYAGLIVVDPNEDYIEIPSPAKLADRLRPLK